MWILPKNLSLPSNSAPDTVEFISELNEQSQICEQSFFVRSKVMRAPIWSRKWRRDSWTLRLSGRILKHSHGQSFVTGWTSLWEAIPVSHSQARENALERPTHATSGPGSQMEFEFSGQEPASSRMSRDTSRWDSPQSSAIWKAWVTRCRGEYSQRLKLARRTGENGYSFWPMITVNESENAGTSPKDRNNPLLGALVGPLDRDNRNSTGSPHGPSDPQGSWSTPRACEATGLGPNSKQQGLCNEVVPEASATKSTGRLNPRWVECLMGVPAGWALCETGNRVDELRALGNGVVPAVAEKAFRTLMKDAV